MSSPSPMAARQHGNHGGGEEAARYLIVGGYECEQEVGLVTVKLLMRGIRGRGEGEGAWRRRAPWWRWRGCCSWLLLRRRQSDE
jgi:hypothetical protein